MQGFEGQNNQSKKKLKRKQSVDRRNWFVPLQTVTNTSIEDLAFASAFLTFEWEWRFGGDSEGTNYSNPGDHEFEDLHFHTDNNQESNQVITCMINSFY